MKKYHWQYEIFSQDILYERCLSQPKAVSLSLSVLRDRTRFRSQSIGSLKCLLKINSSKSWIRGAIQTINLIPLANIITNTNIRKDFKRLIN